MFAQRCDIGNSRLATAQTSIDGRVTSRASGIAIFHKVGDPFADSKTPVVEQRGKKGEYLPPTQALWQRFFEKRFRKSNIHGILLSARGAPEHGSSLRKPNFEYARPCLVLQNPSL
jgi:hypothetical protein